jgi:dTDP-4-amino-4,6-dideoxygalactose transaminase
MPNWSIATRSTTHFEGHRDVYYQKLKPLSVAGWIGIPQIDAECYHCGYNFYIKTKDLIERNQLISFLSDKGVNAQFHYIPLHSTDFALSHGRLLGINHNTENESLLLLRLPLYYDMKKEEQEYVITSIIEYYGEIN